MIECAVWWTSPLHDTERYIGWLGSDELGRYEAYRKDADRRRFITGRVLAKNVLARRLDLPVEHIVFDASCPDCDKQHGPPKLAGSDVTLSISHAGERVGLAVTSGEPVGLDVEATTRRADDSLLSYALNETELAGLSDLPDGERAGTFFTYWTRKEALMKATGRGLRIPLRGITLSGPCEPVRLVAASDDALDPERAWLAGLAPGDGYSAAVAVLTSGAAEEVAVHERWWNGPDG